MIDYTKFKTAYSHLYDEEVTIEKVRVNRGLVILHCKLSTYTNTIMFTPLELRNFK
jgi:hypothetical protein